MALALDPWTCDLARALDLALGPGTLGPWPPFGALGPYLLGLNPGSGPWSPWPWTLNLGPDLVLALLLALT